MTAPTITRTVPTRAAQAEPSPDQTGIRWPSIGVVIPTRNRPQLLVRAIQAVLEQDYPGPVRIAVVYDQSQPDYTLERDGDRPLRVLANWRTPGLAGARNTGILDTDTELVAFCDDDDVWAPSKLTRQVEALHSRAGAEFATCAIEVEYADRITPRLAGSSLVGLDDLVRSRMSMLHASGFLVRRASLVEPGGIGLVAEDAPGSQNEDWDLLLRAAKRSPIVHVDTALVRVIWGRSSHFAYEYETKMSSLRWMLHRHPEIHLSSTGAARVYGQLACWSVASGRRGDAWLWIKAALRAKWWEPRTAVALTAISGVVSIDTVLSALHKHGRGI